MHAPAYDRNTMGSVYVGVGTLIVILVIILIIYLLRRA